MGVRHEKQGDRSAIPTITPVDTTEVIIIPDVENIPTGIEGAKDLTENQILTEKKVLRVITSGDDNAGVVEQPQEEDSMGAYTGEIRQRLNREENKGALQFDELFTKIRQAREKNEVKLVKLLTEQLEEELKKTDDLNIYTLRALTRTYLNAALNTDDAQAAKKLGERMDIFHLKEKLAVTPHDKKLSETLGKVQRILTLVQLVKNLNPELYKTQQELIGYFKEAQQWAPEDQKQEISAKQKTFDVIIDTESYDNKCKKLLNEAGVKLSNAFQEKYQDWCDAAKKMVIQKNAKKKTANG
ncbi:hypothetical protein KKD70_01700 [Patescibacteria group bacterium]|nr:hypothetical protein [Patescibacteria group bacterium]